MWAARRCHWAGSQVVCVDETWAHTNMAPVYGRARRGQRCLGPVRCGQRRTVTFIGESASGWQQASFATPIAINANTTYVASYFAPVGRYSVNENYFSSATTRGPLTALQNGTDGANGVYRYGASGFPTSSYASSNYWVDVMLTTN